MAGPVEDQTLQVHDKLLQRAVPLAIMIPKYSTSSRCPLTLFPASLTDYQVKVHRKDREEGISRKNVTN